MRPRRGGLGRGLDALLEPEPEGLRNVRVDQLQPNQYQPRSDFDDEGLAELAESLRTQGMVQPIVVAKREGGRFTIVAGERRWRAAQRAGLTEVPVVVRELANEQELLEVALVENLQRSDLNPMEEAEAFASLSKGFGLAQEEVAQQVGKSRASVANSMRLLKLPPQVQDLLRAGQLTAGQARPLIGLEAKRAVEWAERAVAEGLTARKLEALTREADRKEKPRKARLDADSRAAADRLSRKLHTKVEIRRRGKKGSLVLHFNDEEELMRLYDLLIGREN